MPIFEKDQLLVWQFSNSQLTHVWNVLESGQGLANSNSSLACGQVWHDKAMGKLGVGMGQPHLPAPNKLVVELGVKNQPNLASYFPGINNC
jgi:hypothetical protein